MLSILYLEEFNLSHFRFLAVLLALCLTAGCKAQTPAGPDPALNRRIEVTVRSEFSIPQDYNVSIGARKPSAYHRLRRRCPSPSPTAAKSQVVDFLISADGKKLARLETFDLTKDPGSDIDIAGRPIRGNPAAKVTVINFDDLECPYCARMHQSLFPATLDALQGQGPLHLQGLPAHRNPSLGHARRRRRQLPGRAERRGLWAYVDYLHSHGDEVTGPDRDLAKSYAALDRIARQEATVGKLDTAKLDACLAKQDETEVNDSLKEASALGLDGAPALFVNGERINGAVPEEQVWMAIDRALRAEGEQPPAAASRPAAPPAANARSR